MAKYKWIKWLVLGLISAFFLSILIWIFIKPPFARQVYSKIQISQIILLILSAVCLSIVAFIISVSKVYGRNKELKKRLAAWSEVSYHISQVNQDVITDMPVGIIVTQSNDNIAWANQQAVMSFGDNIIGMPIRKLTNDFEEKFKAHSGNFVISTNDHKFEVQVRKKNNSYFFFDVTKREEIRQQSFNRQVVVAIISLDNFEDVIQKLDISSQSSVKGSYLSAIADWGLKYNGFIKPYGNDKMMLITYRENLEEMINDKFDILQTIRDISEKNNILVTVSIGIACWKTSLTDVANYAQNAMEIAEKRGGDQVVVNIQDQEIAYFGAKTDQESASSKVGARIKAQNLRKAVTQYRDIYIMGHINADTDAYASMYGMAKLLINEGFNNTYMVVDPERFDNTVKKIHQIVCENDPQIISHHVTPEKATNDGDDNSLLIICDTQSSKIVMDKSVLAKIKNRAIIDHHRATDDSITNNIFEYLEPTASSSCELLVELMDFFALKNDTINAFTATVLYSGILVDTNNFAHRTSARTFEAASRLKSAGADTNEVRKWLRRDMTRLVQINDLITRAELYFNGKVAITQTEEIINDPVLPAQVSDELLQIDGVEASFSIVPISDHEIAISARSLGLINVQLIMEAMHGGGHFSAAATKLRDVSLETVFNQLKEILTIEFESKGEAMKILLLEDLANKGHKNDIVEVPSGYGNFLIRNGSALLATDEVIKARDAELKQEEEAKAVRIEMLKKLASDIATKTINIKVQVGLNGKLFGKVTTSDIATNFYEQTRIIIDRKKINLPMEINSLGIYTAVVELGFGIETQFAVNVTEL